MKWFEICALRILIILQVMGLLCAPQAFAMAFCRTLHDCYFQALKAHETVGIQQELVEQAEERYYKSLSGVLPSLQFSTTYMRQEQVSSSGVISNFSNPEQTTHKFTVTQPLFRGLKEFAMLKAEKRSQQATKAEKQRVLQLLYSDVATAFYNVLSLQKDAQNIHKLVELSQERMKELEERRRIGRSRASEVLTVESQLKTLIAQEESLAGQVQTAIEALYFVTGAPPSQGARIEGLRLVDDVNVPQPLASVTYFLSQRGQRPDIQAGEQKLEAAESVMFASHGGHLPSVDFMGNYYLKRPGVLTDVSWDVQLTATMPLFQGGAVRSEERDAVSRQRQAELELARTRRNAELEIAQSYESLKSLHAQIQALEEAHKIAEKNYKTQNQEYRLGLVANLDVLQAMNSFLEAKRSLDKAKFMEKLEYVKMQVAIGKGGPSS